MGQTMPSTLGADDTVTAVTPEPDMSQSAPVASMPAAPNVTPVMTPKTMTMPSQSPVSSVNAGIGASPTADSVSGMQTSSNPLTTPLAESEDTTGGTMPKPAMGSETVASTDPSEDSSNM